MVTDGSVTLQAGGMAVFGDTNSSGDVKTWILSWDDYGDMLARIDTWSVTGATGFIMETWYEDIPTESAQ